MAKSDRQIGPHEPVLVFASWTLFALLLLFIVYPIACVLVTSLKDPQGSWTVEAFRQILSVPHLRKPIVHTLFLGISSAFFSTLIGFVFAYAVSRTDILGKRFWWLTAMFPLVSPPFLVALSAITLFGNNGLLTEKLLGGVTWFSIYGFGGLLLAQTLAFFPTAFLVCSALLVSIDPALEEAALNAGASRTRAFWTVIFPLSFPAVLSSFLLVFIESLADFANPLVLSGNFKVLSVEAYLKIVGSEQDLAGGSALVLFLLVPSLIAFSVQQIWLSQNSFVTVTGKPSTASIQRLSRKARAVWLSTCTALSILIYLFYGTVFVGSLIKIWGVDPSFTLEHYREALSSEWPSIRDSLLLAAIATPFSGILGIIIAYFVVRTQFKIRYAIEWTSLLTFAVPGTVVGIGYILAFNRPPIEIHGTWLAIVLLFLFRNAPVGIRSGIAALHQIDRSIEEASANLGAGRGLTVRKIVLPLLAPAFFSGLAFAFVRCMNSISAVIFVVSSRWHLLTISIMNFFENGDLSKAAALCVVLMVLVLSVIGLLKVLVPSPFHNR